MKVVVRKIRGYKSPGYTMEVLAVDESGEAFTQATQVRNRHDALCFGNGLITGLMRLENLADVRLADCNVIFYPDCDDLE